MDARIYLLCELVLLQLFEYPESEIFVLLVPDSDSIIFQYSIFICTNNIYNETTILTKLSIKTNTGSINNTKSTMWSRRSLNKTLSYGTSIKPPWSNNESDESTLDRINSVQVLTKFYQLELDKQNFVQGCATNCKSKDSKWNLDHFW